MPNIAFKVNPDKALEAIVYIAHKLGCVDKYHVVKTMFFADKEHLNRYARPILGDTYIRMRNGPVPSYVLDIINLKEDKISFDVFVKAKAALEVGSDKKQTITARREPDLSFFSDTDLECLDNAIKFCKDKNFDDLKEITHEEKAWKKASINGCMDYELFLDDDNPYKEEIIQDLKEDSLWMAF
ncbi:MAG: SocA family protein [Alphaproteobacteria bacterium]|nr:SocA family protein [Alphaproteobacteria bacterium]